MAEGRCTVLTRSEGREKFCFVIRGDDEHAEVLSLIAPAPEAIDRKRYRVNGETYRAIDPNSHWRNDIF